MGRGNIVNISLLQNHSVLIETCSWYLLYLSPLCIVLEYKGWIVLEKQKVECLICAVLDSPQSIFSNGLINILSFMGWVYHITDEQILVYQC